MRKLSQISDDSGMMFSDGFVGGFEFVEIFARSFDHCFAGIAGEAKDIGSEAAEFVANGIEGEGGGFEQEFVEIGGFDLPGPFFRFVGEDLEDEPGHRIHEANEEKHVGDVEDGLGVGDLPGGVGGEPVGPFEVGRLR